MCCCCCCCCCAAEHFSSWPPAHTHRRALFTHLHTAYRQVPKEWYDFVHRCYCHPQSVCKMYACMFVGIKMCPKGLFGHFDFWVRWIQEGFTAEPLRNDSGANFQWNDSDSGPKVRVTARKSELQTKSQSYSRQTLTDPQEMSIDSWGNEKIEPKFFSSQTFRAPPGYPGKIPGYPAPKVWFLWFRGTYRTFWPKFGLGSFG